MKKPILIIDPGHGGKDPGGGSNNHWKEKDLVLRISLYMRDRFRALGVPVAMTREDDRTLGSADRTKLVRDSGAVFCISNHINAGGGRGWELIHSIYDSGELAKSIERAFVKTGMPKRRIFTRTLPNNPKADYYFMHRETGSVKTLIVEYGFADNVEDTKYLLEHWKDMAEAVVRGLCEFIGEPYHSPVQESAYPEGTPQYKKDAVEYLYQTGALSDPAWRKTPDAPVTLWMLGDILRDARK